MSAFQGTGAEIVGREAELAALHEFVERRRLHRALILSGGPGIGKTTLWEAAVDAARRRLRVLTARPSGAEAQLGFSALADLMDEVETGELAGLPAPQVRALEVALLRAEPAGAPLEQRAIALGFLNALRALAADSPLLVAIDDVQWLDSPSSETLVFAARRLESEAVAFLLTRRSGSASPLERAFEANGLDSLEVGALSLGATRRLLSDRLGFTLSRHALRRIFDVARGNPFFALELGRSLADRPPLTIGEELPLPDAVEDLVGTRVEGLSEPLRRLLLAVALSAGLRTAQVLAITDPVTLEEAVATGLLLVDGERVRVSHPLLAAAARTRSRPEERRRLHLELARVITDEELRTHHLTLATEHPDAKFAAAVSASARRASERGAVEDAVQLAEHALRLTPPESSERSERLIELGQYLRTAGRLQAIADLLAPELDELPPGPTRGRAHLLLTAAAADISAYHEHIELALAESADDAGLRAAVLTSKSGANSVFLVEQIADAEAWARDEERRALNALAWARILRGQRIDDLHQRFQAASGNASHIYESTDRLVGIRLGWRGNIGEARTILTRLVSLVDQRGEELSYVVLRLQLCELELRAGEWEAASALLEDWAQSADVRALSEPDYKRCRAQLAAGRGLPDEAEEWAASAIAEAEAQGGGWARLEALRARGVAALLVHQPKRAVESLSTVWEHTRREGVDEPGAFPVAPDLVEALVACGDHKQALEVARRLRSLAGRQRHPWGLATADRCEAVIRLATGPYDEEAAEALLDAAAAYEQLGLRFDHARTLLALGRFQRRWRKWGAARRSLGEAAAAFEEIGSPGWGEQARAELGRVGARRPRPTGELTPTERLVAERAADGLSNKEIAAALFVTVHTVEVHLSHAYAKLGVRSRSQLASRLKD